MNPIKTQHTPGPWMSIGPAIFQNHSPVAFLSDEQISRVATIEHFDDGLDPYDLLSPDSKIASEARANARLIASAPDLLKQRDELLAALKAIVCLTLNYEAGSQGGNAFAQARAALKKAGVV